MHSTLARAAVFLIYELCFSLPVCVYKEGYVLECTGPVEARRGHQIAWREEQVAWVLGTRPLQEQCVLLATKLSLQPKLRFLKSIFYCNSNTIDKDMFHIEMEMVPSCRRRLCCCASNPCRVLKASVNCPGRGVCPHTE